MAEKPETEELKNLAKIAGYALLALAGYKVAAFLGKRIVKGTATNFITHLTSDDYDENLWGFFSSSRRAGLQNIVEIGLRAERGERILRPLGSPRKIPDLDGLVFDFTYLKRLPTPLDVPIDMKVTLGKGCNVPLEISMPVMVSGMAYGLALSEEVKIALARGASMAGTATNTGEGPPLPEERQHAEKLIVQLSRGGWTDIDAIRSADMIEIQLGQGASGGIGTTTSWKELKGRAARLIDLSPGQNALTHAHLPGVTNLKELRRLVNDLKYESGGVPIGAKMGAGTISLEHDMNLLLEAGVDFITLDGSNAATKGSLPVLQDDFGLPTVMAIPRAVRFLEGEGMRDKVDLIAAGGLLTPGDYLKAIALGANAVYSGTAVLFAVSHRQIEKVLPWEPPGTLTWYTGKKKAFNIEEGAKYLANYLNSVKEEMSDALRAMGKRSIRELNRDDLRSLDLETYLMTGVEPAFPPQGISRLFDLRK